MNKKATTREQVGIPALMTTIVNQVLMQTNPELATMTRATIAENAILGKLPASAVMVPSTLSEALEFADRTVVNQAGTEALTPDQYRYRFASVVLADHKPLVDELVTAFVPKIQEVQANLTWMRNEVTRLSASVTTRQNAILARDPMVARHLQLTQTDVTYPVLHWEKLDRFGSESTIREPIDALVNTKGAYSPSAASLARGNLPLINKTNPKQLKDTTLTPEVKDRIATVLEASFSFEYTKPMMLRAVELMSTGWQAKSFLMKMMELTPRDRLVGQLEHILDGIEMVLPLMKALKTNILDLSKESMEALDNNRLIFEEYFRVAAYQVYLHRRTTFGNLILIPTTMESTHPEPDQTRINPDLMGRLTEKGLGDMAITHYRAVYGVPKYGLHVDELLKSHDHLEKKYAAEVAQVSARLPNLTMLARQQALEWAFLEFSKQFAAERKLPHTQSMYSLAKGSAAGLISNPKAPIEDVMYSFITHLKYSRTMTEQVFNRLKTTYAESLKTKTSFTSADREAAEAGVLAGIVAEFLTTKFIKA